MNALEPLRDLLATRIFVLDGAIGTMLPYVIDKDALVLADPERVRRVHDAYLDAGADIIKTNTFRAVDYETNVAGARLARAAADDWSRRTPDRPRFVAGVLGPMRAAPDQMREAYEAQVRGLMAGGVDLLLIETIVDTRAALAAAAAAAGHAIPLMFSATVDRAGRLPAGETLEAFVAAIDGARPFSVGLNCAHGARDIEQPLTELARLSNAYISCHPSAGLPDLSGAYGEGPDETAAILGGLAQRGLVNIVGGCCGTTPDHIRALAEAVAGLAPRRQGRMTS